METYKEKEETGTEIVWGRRRPRSLDKAGQEEVERSRSAKTKKDPLSVYEATLLKLRNGSVQAFIAPLDGTRSPNSSSDGGDDYGAVQNKLGSNNGIS